jgi:hypothetical protein
LKYYTYLCQVIKNIINEKKKKMGLKDLFFINNEEEEKPETVAPIVTEAVKFPGVNETSNMTPPTTFPNVTPTVASINNPSCQPHLEKIIQLYESGFDGLNQAGYDFYEFYKAVVSGGIDNPQVYAMALSMGKAMDGNVSKESLLSQSQYYFDEIMKVHKSYVDNGTTKKNQLLSTKENERSQLSSELDGLKMQMEAISNQIVSKQSSLSEIDNKYANELTEVDCKLMANDVAKDKILSSINAVKQGLTNNLN